ncbi:uncharacterized protein T551_02030 [Pneumocystis jirovecii RU7]|nr:uncharacterized protein T551_02030 [Pneumocystis jirovecii RU7]KTW30086.1 hypothetical protein T551_02030 [Pneumocystis jirovecii RU7]
MKRNDTKLHINERKYKKLTKELNKFFHKYSISDPISLEDLSVDHMIQLYEAFYNTQFPFTNRKNSSKKTQIKYLKLLLGTISHESLRIDLSHIDPVLVVEHDMESIINIVEVLVIIGNLQLLKEKIAMKQEENDEGNEKDDDSSISCQRDSFDEETDNSQNNDVSVCSSLKDSHNTICTPNSLASSESLSIVSYINNRANKVFNRIHSLNPTLTHSACHNQPLKKESLIKNKNAKYSKNSKTIKNIHNCQKNKNNNKTSKLSYRSIGTQTSLSYFSEIFTDYQTSPLPSSINTSYKNSYDIGPCSIKKMMQKVSLNTWDSESSENELSESGLSSEGNTDKISIDKKLTKDDFYFDFDNNFFKKKNENYHDKTLKENFGTEPSTLDNNKKMYPHILHTSYKNKPLYFKENISQESSPNSDTTNIAFFRKKIHRSLLKVDSPYTLYLRKRRRNALNALYAQRSHLEQNLKSSLKERKKKSLNNSKTGKIKNIPYQNHYNTHLSDISFYSLSEPKSQAFFSQYNENFTEDLEERLMSAKKLYSKESYPYDDLISKIASHKI